VVFIITKDHGKSQHLQQHKADESDVLAYKKKYITHERGNFES
jgi:hypothetical protein